MNTQSNSYTFLYSAVLVIVFAAILSVAALNLQPIQQKNREIEKKQNILASIHITGIKDSIPFLFEQYVKKSYTTNLKGEVVTGDAFTINMKEELSKPDDQQKLAVFECSLPDSQKIFVFPVRGAGLWGPIWGYVSIKSDFNTVFGAYFDHEGETPGLGAEIALPEFQRQFDGKKIFDTNDVFTSIKVLKPGLSDGNVHAVDGISGGTITSKGLESMLENSLSRYQPFFKITKIQ